MLFAASDDGVSRVDSLAVERRRRLLARRTGDLAGQPGHGTSPSSNETSVKTLP